MKRAPLHPARRPLQLIARQGSGRALRGTLTEALAEAAGVAETCSLVLTLPADVVEFLEALAQSAQGDFADARVEASDIAASLLLGALADVCDAAERG